MRVALTAASTVRGRLWADGFVVERHLCPRAGNRDRHEAEQGSAAAVLRVKTAHPGVPGWRPEAIR
ncbi:hypothetical protein [Lentzea jiangxiensis]|uniref:Uncharacterized protein n=1 Tax=Lentzea jiangxiensis TaxID=641025 RepID=A0A1H0KZB0_9PSEU|nr:hypothetical protein [Lentzea jiangxiensis]SDO61112.1 hypothetical protein SAMN05421507_103119 [Lentzea jiangxiensis]